jgi:hypothetical protein
MLLAFVSCTKNEPIDEAKSAGKSTADFPQITADIFKPMDGGIDLSSRFNSSTVQRFTAAMKSACVRGGSPAVSCCHGGRSQTRLSQYFFVRRALRQFVPQFRADDCGVSALERHSGSGTAPAFSRNPATTRYAWKL